MNLLRSRVHHLIDRMSNEELETLWVVLQDLYCDFYMIRAIQASKKNLQPGDTLTRAEATRILNVL